MARTIAPERFTQLIEVATSIFISHGYRQTQMADIAVGLGVAKGTLYGYVESKDALFDAAIRFADGHNPTPRPEELPLRRPGHGETVRYVRQRLAAEAAEMAVLEVLQGELVIEEPCAELTTVLEDLYRRLLHNRFAIKLVDRCAPEYAELAEVWFDEGRWAQHRLLTQLIERRFADGSYRLRDHVGVIARTMLETIAFWAVHRHFDPSSQDVSDRHAQQAVIDLLSRGLVEVGS